MIMQDRAKRTMFYHDLGKCAKINHVLDKGSLVATSIISTRYLNRLGISKINKS